MNNSKKLLIWGGLFVVTIVVYGFASGILNFSDFQTTVASPSTTNEAPPPTAEELAREREAKEAKAKADKEAKEAKAAQEKAALEARKKERAKQLKAFPISLQEVKITYKTSKGGAYKAYVSVKVKNKGKHTVNEFWFDYIAYDSDGGVRADAGDETLYYNGKIKPGETLDLISKGVKWEVSDHVWSDYYDDYGNPDYYDRYNENDIYMNSERAEVHDILGVEVSIFQANASDGSQYSLDVFTRKWSDVVWVK